MGITGITIDVPCKRFETLRIAEIPEACRLVMLIGPNGSGKSSVFEALLYWARAQCRSANRNVEDGYYSVDSSVQRGQVVLTSVPELRGSDVHLGTAHRNTLDVLATSMTGSSDLSGVWVPGVAQGLCESDGV